MAARPAFLRALAALSLILVITGCATCEHHPAACTAAIAVIGASIAISRDHRGAADAPIRASRRGPCSRETGC